MIREAHGDIEEADRRKEAVLRARVTAHSDTRSWRRKAGTTWRGMATACRRCTNSARQSCPPPTISPLPPRHSLPDVLALL